MDEKQLRQIIEETASATATRTRDQFAALAEGLEKKIELVTEAVAGNAERFERQQSETHKEVREKIQLVADAVAGNARRLDRLESEMHREFDEVRSMIRLLTPSWIVACDRSKRPSVNCSLVWTGWSLVRLSRSLPPSSRPL